MQLVKQFMSVTEGRSVQVNDPVPIFQMGRVAGMSNTSWRINVRYIMYVCYLLFCRNVLKTWLQYFSMELIISTCGILFMFIICYSTGMSWRRGSSTSAWNWSYQRAVYYICLFFVILQECLEVVAPVLQHAIDLVRDSKKEIKVTHHELQSTCVSNHAGLHGHHHTILAHHHKQHHHGDPVHHHHHGDPVHHHHHDHENRSGHVQS